MKDIKINDTVINKNEELYFMKVTDINGDDITCKWTSDGKEQKKVFKRKDLRGPSSEVDVFTVPIN